MNFNDVKIKLFIGTATGIDNQINSWLEKNNADFLDLKYVPIYNERFDRIHDRAILIYRPR